ncbi:peroxide stress protein YaaA [Galactobacter valiniphilus]|uniref:Peroxide stress protein YaaA n=1 Tax=Galactobacter valiniphilus TaxID=2676122 RepID=A0A399J669_9MICC|nr:peroxide stress protein YaaA [Galactobacter valiniphilus]RII40915.1 peroxide stress protein YaaA [Galactobacter valiniphilus]
MLILLPPSEGKNRPESGAPYSPEALSFPELGEAREQTLAALADVSASPEAMSALGVGASLEPEVRANVTAASRPAAPAHSVYSGVLYDALGYSSLTAAQRAKADSSVVVVSALWGAVGFGDPIPSYRLSMGVGLPELGKLASWWKPRLTPALNARAEGELVVDCRSSTYAAAYKAPVGSTVTVDVVQIRGNARKVVSHFAKHTRGEIARLLLATRGTGPRTPQALLELVRERWPLSELESATKTKAARLVVVLPEDHAFTARA